MSKVYKSRSIVMPSIEEDRTLVAAAKGDPDALPLTSKQLKSMVPMTSLRGRPKSANPKKLVSVRYSPEVIEYFRASGDGWQSRMDEVLRNYVLKNTRRA
jgi:uncharacterized protein (DUF4415 family)